MSDFDTRSDTWTIPQLTEWVNAVLRQTLGDEIWIEGEISNLQRSASGHVYFTLIESSASSDPRSELTAHTAVDTPADTPARKRSTPPQTLSVTLFDWHRKNVNHHLTRTGGGVRMSDGVRVRIRGSVEIYGARSQIQLKMTGIDPIFTLGTLAADRDRLMARLRADGLLTLNRQLHVPSLPRSIAVITSIGSAAHADVIHEFTAADVGFDLLVIDARVQGADAESSLIAALAHAAEAGVELIAVVRGGGARTDLAVFDTEALARAVATSPIPVWVGLGHETDRTVVDEVAHQAHKTPTACAAAVVAAASQGREMIFDLWEQIDGAATAVLNNETKRLDRLGRRMVTSSEGSLTASRSRLDRSAGRVARLAIGHLNSADAALANASASMGRSAPRKILDHERRIAALGSTLKAYDPHTTLTRGFSITRLNDGRVATAAIVGAGTQLTTTLADGTVDSTVDVVTAELSDPIR